jgi:hypothetical protein
MDKGCVHAEEVFCPQTLLSVLSIPWNCSHELKPGDR